jgi:outer membrane protein assembly factor BamE (lipoprotein component of BamABCDE complex)
MKLTASVITLLALCFPSMGNAQIKYNIDNNIFYAEPHREKLGDQHLTLLGLTLGMHTLKDVEVRLGSTQILSRKEHAPDQLCYISAEKGDETVIVFEAGPLGGWEILTAFRIISSKLSFKKTDQCRETSYISKRTQTKTGIRVGITREQLIAILGSPSKVIGNNFFFLFSVQRRMSEDEIRDMERRWPDVRKNPYFDVSSSVHATFSNSELSSVCISKIESYELNKGSSLGVKPCIIN